MAKLRQSASQTTMARRDIPAFCLIFYYITSRQKIQESVINYLESRKVISTVCRVLYAVSGALTVSSAKYTNMRVYFCAKRRKIKIYKK